MTNLKSQQIINFDESDDSWPVYIYSRDVKVLPSSNTREIDSQASTKITTQNVVDYSWEDRYTLGHLISYHSHTKLVAYVLSISNNYMIRVLNEENSSRCLIKEFSGEITDIEFSKSKVPYVASIDVNGSVKINKMIVNEEVLECQMVLHIKSNPLESMSQPKISYSRVMWCCHNDVDDVAVQQVSETGTNISLLLGIVHGATFEVLQVDTIESELSGIGVQYDAKVERAALQLIKSSFQEQYADSENLAELFLPYLCYTAPGDGAWITSLAISSDAAAFAVALHDGSVHFFTLDGSAPSGLKEAYSWRPFDGDVVWSLLFLDDCRPGHITDSFWCHVIVGGAFNRQLKLFRCDKWDCVQTVTFHSPNVPCLMTAHIDLSARFLIMTDIRLKVLYLLEIDTVDNGQTKLFKSVEEFVLLQPLLSFDVNSITCSPSCDGAVQVSMKLFTITKTAFQKMRVVYLSKGHRMNEVVLMDEEEEEERMVDIMTKDVCGVVAHSVLTQVSSLPSPASSFQDPAIISSTQAHKDFPSLNLATSSEQLPPNLQHLFSSVLSHTHNDLAKDIHNHDSGDESEDETSLDDEMLVSGRKQRGSEDKYGDDEEEEEECGFPLPPYTSNGKWSAEMAASMINDYRVSREQVTVRDNGQKSNKNEELLSRLVTMMESQRLETEKLSRSIREMSETMKQCNCREARQMWGNEAAKQVSDGCQRVVSTQLGGCVRDAMELALPRISGEVSNRLSEDVRGRLATVEPVIREFTTNLLHDKKFITFMGGSLAEAMEKNLRAVYVDMVRKELVPALGRTMDKLFADTRDLFKDGVREVMTSVEQSNKAGAKTLEDRLGAILAGHKTQGPMSVDMESYMRKMVAEVANGRTTMVEAVNGQTVQMARMSETLQSVKEALVANGPTSGDVSTNHMSRVNSVMNITSPGESLATREQKIQRLLAANNHVGALDEALSLTNLRVLISVCSRVRSKSVLSCTVQKPSPLAGSSILALIQQLSRDFNDHLDLKIGYLFDAMLSLDTNEPSIRDHVSKVLKGVHRRLHQYSEQETVNVNKDKVAFLLRLVTSRLDSQD